MCFRVYFQTVAHHLSCCMSIYLFLLLFFGSLLVFLSVPLTLSVDLSSALSLCI
jgi:hypothetical protein